MFREDHLEDILPSFFRKNCYYEIMKTRAHLLIKGRVQGVGFRWFVADIATTFGLAGWTKNLFDGRVEAIFEGERETIEAAIERCADGPRSAIVSGIDVDWNENPEDITGFGIRY